MAEIGLLAFGGMGLALVGLAGLYGAGLIAYLTGQLRQARVEIDGLRAERTRQAGEIFDLEQKLQITLVENAMLSAKRDASTNIVS